MSGPLLFLANGRATDLSLDSPRAVPEEREWAIAEVVRRWVTRLRRGQPPALGAQNGTLKKRTEGLVRNIGRSRTTLAMLYRRAGIQLKHLSGQCFDRKGVYFMRLRAYTVPAITSFPATDSEGDRSLRAVVELCLAPRRRALRSGWRGAPSRHNIHKVLTWQRWSDYWQDDTWRKSSQYLT